MRFALEARGLWVQRAGRTLLDVPELRVPAGRWTAVVGPNGAGKSTLLQVLAGLLPGSLKAAGQLRLLGRDWRDWSAPERARQLAWMGQQDSTDTLCAADVVMLGRLPHQAWLAGPSAQDHDRVRVAMQATQAWALRGRPVGQLSAGERQRVLLARLLAVDAQVLLMDEPLANLDPPHQADWLALVRDLVAQGKTVVSVLHELSVALQADELLAVQAARVVHQGPCQDPATHVALSAVFGQRVAVQRLAGQWVALPQAAPVQPCTAPIASQADPSQWPNQTPPRAGRGKAVMVLGTSSGAGKSWLTTALCRHYARMGLRVAPFKAQNMSNNARVVAGGEIGSAQYFQALAARTEPDVRMNPLLLKPERDTHSQVVWAGQVDPVLTGLDWRRRSQVVWPRIQATLDALLAEFDLVVIEGAGSPAEINLADCDIVNMRVAEHARAACLLVSDIDRGGAFAHLYGTWALLPAPQRQRIQGFVLNKFRGDAALLAPGPQMLQDLTGVPTLGVLPLWRQHGLPEEDGMLDLAAPRPHSPGPSGLPRCTVAVVAYPRISNLDELASLQHLSGVALRWAHSPADLHGADWVILPGSKHTSSDLAWLRAQGLDAAIAAHAAQGRAVLGICGGLQMLGEALLDPHGVDGNAPGLGLLPLVTVFEPTKTVQTTEVAFAPTMAAPWSALQGLRWRGYEIHQGQSQLHPDMPACACVVPGLAWQQGAVLGLYVHGLFEDPACLQALFGGEDGLPRTLDAVLDGLADFVAQHMAPGALDALIHRA